MEITKFERIDYLKNGTPRQCRAYEVLSQQAVFMLLEEFQPLLVGTIPIDIDTETSDLDIICTWKDKEDFKTQLVVRFGHQLNFNVYPNEELNAMVASFRLEEFEVELFAQSIPTRQQYAYRHMIVEHRLLLEHGEAFRQEIIRLKRIGHKTEPAFAIALGLTGNPYEELLKLYL